MAQYRTTENVYGWPVFTPSKPISTSCSDTGVGVPANPVSKQDVFTVTADEDGRSFRATANLVDATRVRPSD